MRGGAVFLSFFILFTLASLAVPAPLFPGNVVPTWLGLPLTASSSLVSALVNGVTYGLVIWLVYILATRRLDESGVSSYQEKKDRNQRNSKRRAIKH